MSVTHFIAVRYLFSRSRMGAVGWVSAISTVAIAVVSMALVVALSVYNGYVRMIYEAADQSTPDLIIEADTARLLSVASESPVVQALEQAKISAWSPLIRYKGVLRSDEGESMVEVVGVDDAYWQHIASDSLLLDGRAPTQQSESAELVVGLGVAGSLSGYSAQERRLYFPKRRGLINPLAPASAFRSSAIEVVGYLRPFGEEQSQQAYTHISVMRELLDMDEGQATSVAVKLPTGMSERQAKGVLQARLGDAYRVLDRSEQHPELTLLIRMEKVMVLLIMAFVLLLAALNLVNGLAMLIMEKEQDLATLRAMGLTTWEEGKVFALTGLMISLLGSATGLLVGLGLCWLQQRFEWLEAGDGFVSMPYPIEIYGSDVFLILGLTVFVACVISVIPLVIFRKNRRA